MVSLYQGRAFFELQTKGARKLLILQSGVRLGAQPTPPTCAHWEAEREFQAAPKAQSSGELIRGPGRPPLDGEPTAPRTFVGDTHVPRECPGRGMTGLGESTPPPGAETARGARALRGSRAPRAKLAADGTRDHACLSVLSRGSMSHASAGGG